MAYTTTQKPTEYLFYMHVHKKAMYLWERQMQLHLEIEQPTDITSYILQQHRPCIRYSSTWQIDLAQTNYQQNSTNSEPNILSDRENISKPK